MELIVELLLQVFAEVLFEVLVSVGFDRARQSRRTKSAMSLPLALFGYVCLGSLLGGISLAVYGQRLSSNDLVSALGVIANPLLAGAALSKLGAWRRSRGRPATHLASFWGGFCFALGFSGIRYAWLVSLG